MPLLAAIMALKTAVQSNSLLDLSGLRAFWSRSCPRGAEAKRRLPVVSPVAVCPWFVAICPKFARGRLPVVCGHFTKEILFYFSLLRASANIYLLSSSSTHFLFYLVISLIF